MSTFITRLETTGSGPRLAVKDLIDVEGVPTTAGCRALERIAAPARRDAALLRGAREMGARIVGKANLHELAAGPVGINPWFGTPVNPLDADLVPGGSSSGSAVAVANDEADVAFGTDTGGSIRIPSACCGTAGLKTTHGRVPVKGVWPLAVSFDTVGPMARDVAGLELGMRMLEPGFEAAPAPAGVVGRVRTSSDARIEDAVDAALAAAGLEVAHVDFDVDAVADEWLHVFLVEVFDADHRLLEADPDGIGRDVRATIEAGATLPRDLDAPRAAISAWRDSVLEHFDRVQLLVLPTLPIFAPTIERARSEWSRVVSELTRHTRPINAAGLPALSMPVAVANSRIPASLQLVGPPMSEELLISSAAMIEAAQNR